MECCSGCGLRVGFFGIGTEKIRWTDSIQRLSTTQVPFRSVYGTVSQCYPKGPMYLYGRMQAFCIRFSDLGKYPPYQYIGPFLWVRESRGYRGLKFRIVG